MASSTIQFWGLGSGLSNTSELIDAMLISETNKVSTYNAKITLANGKKNAWNDLKSSLESMNDMIKNLSGVGKQNFRTATTSADGYLTTSVSSKAIAMDYTINVKQLATKHSVSGTKVADINASLNTAGSFKINGVEIEVTSEDSLNSVMKKINSATDSTGKSIGASAYIIDGVLVVESKESGVDNALQFEDSNGILNSLGLIKDDGSLNTSKAPKNAMIEVNGILIERNSNTIDDAIDGVTLNLTKTTKEAITLSVKNDTTNIKTMITDFVNAYNELMTKIDKYTAYDSAAGTSGILNGDTSVSTIKTAISSVMQSTFAGGEFSFLFDIGVSVDRYGKYQIDESKLDAALSKNSDAIVSMLTKGLENPTSTPDSSNGLFVSMKNAINNLIGGTTNLFTSKADSLDAQIKNYNKLISKQESYIEKRKATLEAQFTALESTMSSLNSTSSLLTQMSNNSNKD